MKMLSIIAYSSIFAVFAIADRQYPGIYSQPENIDFAEYFNGGDNDDDGKMSFDEFLMRDKFWVEMQRRLFDEIDQDDDGYITEQDMRDYYAAQRRIAVQMDEDKARRDFQMADLNRNGFVSRAELERFAQQQLGIDTRPENFNRFFNSIDRERDGKLDYNEFKKFDETWYRSEYPLVFLPNRPEDRQPTARNDGTQPNDDGDIENDANQAQNFQRPDGNSKDDDDTEDADQFIWTGGDMRPGRTYMQMKPDFYVIQTIDKNKKKSSGDKTSNPSPMNTGKASANVPQSSHLKPLNTGGGQVVKSAIPAEKSHPSVALPNL